MSDFKIKPDESTPAELYKMALKAKQKADSKGAVDSLIEACNYQIELCCNIAIQKQKKGSSMDRRSVAVIFLNPAVFKIDLVLVVDENFRVLNKYRDILLTGARVEVQPILGTVRVKNDRIDMIVPYSEIHFIDSVEVFESAGQ